MRMWMRGGAALLAIALLGACDTGDPLAPFEPEVTNAPDNFQMQATGVRGVTLSRDYVWQNSGVRADVNQATQVAAGTATLRIFDPNGTERYARSLAENGTFETGTGVPGSWRIRVVLSGFHGTLNFRVQKHE